SDADVDHEAKRLPRATGDRTTAHALREREHARTLGEHRVLDLGAADAGAARLAQRHVQHRAVFRRIDVLTAPHGIEALAQADQARALGPPRPRDLLPALPRKVQAQSRARVREALEA